METRSNYIMVGAVTVALLAGVLLFIVWLAGISNKSTKCYDVYFGHGVGGLNKGSNVSFSGVPVGQVSKISLLPNRPEFVWVRIEVDEQTPVLQGTTAQIHGVGFTGVSEIQLDRRRARQSADPAAGSAGLPGRPVERRRAWRPVAKRAGAHGPHPEADRAADRADERQEPECNRRYPREYRCHHAAAPPASPQMAQTIREIQIASHNAGVAANNIAALRDNTNHLVNDEGKPAAQDLRKAIASMQQATDNLNGMITDARPGVQNFSKSTLLRRTGWSTTCAI